MVDLAHDPDMGRILRARRSFAVNEVCFTEEPFLIANSADEVEKVSVALPAAEQKRFWEFQHDVDETGRKDVASVWDLNAYQTDASGGRGLYELIAKIPHACSPNVSIAY